MRCFKNISSFICGKHVFCGIDVHIEHFVVCFVCDGDVVERIKIASEYSCLIQRLRAYSAARQISCVYEAGFSGFWLWRRLQSDGYGCIVTPPSLAPQTGTKVKTDQRDAEKLASYLSAGLLKAIWVPPVDLEADRHVIRRRAQLVKILTRAKNQIRSFLNLHGIKRPEEIKSNWSQKYLAWLESLEFDYESEGLVFAHNLKSYRRLRDDLAEITRYLRKMSKSAKYEKNFALLTSVRGVGLITGMTFLLEIYDFGRFDTQGKFASYLGLTPSQYSSGEHVRLGHITRFGNAHLRRVLVESAWTVIRHDPHLRAKYERIRARGNKGKKAIVAVARSLAIRLRRGLLDQTGYVIGIC